MSKRVVKIQPAQNFAASIALWNEPVSTAVINLLFCCNFAGSQRRCARDDFKRRARRIFARDSLVVHRVIWVRINGVPVARRNAVRK